jgi:hypothetical protein
VLKPIPQSDVQQCTWNSASHFQLTCSWDRRRSGHWVGAASRSWVWGPRGSQLHARWSCHLSFFRVSTWGQRTTQFPLQLETWGSGSPSRRSRDLKLNTHLQPMPRSVTVGLGINTLRLYTACRASLDQAAVTTVPSPLCSTSVRFRSWTFIYGISNVGSRTFICHYEEIIVLVTECPATCQREKHALLLR